MYKACRHIKSSGLRCQSRALAGANFCYFHSRLHNLAAEPETEPLKLPPIEDLDSIPIAVARISEALIAGRIDVKVSAQLFWGLKLASLAIAGRVNDQPYSVLSVTQSEQGDDLAPEENRCVREDECETCKDIFTCPKSLFEMDEESEDDEDNTGEAEGEEKEGGEEKDRDDNSGGQDDENSDDHSEAENGKDDNDDDDGETTEELVADAKYLESVSNALDVGDIRQVARLLKESSP
ncbi:MAG: hypothetical protein ABSE53_16810 [Terracidiphilus sp.]|jgi:hypothetical protein